MPLNKVGRGFFSFHVGLALALEIIALALDRSKISVYGSFVASLIILSILFAVRKLRWTRTLLGVTAVLGAGALGVDAMASGAWTVKLATALAVVSSALVLGSILVTMNLGHWYLVIKGLPFELLGVANRTFVRALLFRIFCIAVGAGLTAHSWKLLFAGSTGPLWDTTLFLTVRALFGLAAPLLLSWMVNECVKIKSNQSATGILYVSLVFVLIGEESGLYFLVERGVPL